MRFVIALALAALSCNGAPPPDTRADSTPSPAPASPASAASAASAPPADSEGSLPAAPAAPAADDLAADIRLSAALARPHLWGEQIDVEDGAFLLVADSRSVHFKSSIDLVRRALGPLYNGRFSAHPKQAITAYVMDKTKDYQAICKDRLGRPCRSPFGEYFSDTREIIANQERGDSTLLHELVHPILEGDFPSAPRWLREGIAALFENPVFPAPGEIHGATNWRLPRLRRALSSPAEGAMVHLDAMFRFSDSDFDDEAVAPVAYGVARFACQWLDSPGQDGLWRFYRTWRDHAAEDPTGERSFTEAVGQSPADADAAWQKWVRAL